MAGADTIEGDLERPPADRTLRLELTGMAVNGKMVPLVTGEYVVTGKSRGESTAKRTAGGAALERSSVQLLTAAREQRSARDLRGDCRCG